VASGIFWSADNPDVRVAGELTAEVGSYAVASLSQNLVPDPRVTITKDPERRQTTMAFSALPERSVRSFLPITLHGQLGTGDSVTLLHAQNYGAAGNFAPQYRAPAAVLGVKVTNDQLYRAVRFRMDRPHWLQHMSAGESSEIEDGSTLTVDSSDGENWLVYESSSPLTLRQLEIRVISGCLALLHLAIYPDEDKAIRDTQVRIEPGGAWLTVIGPAFWAEWGELESQPLLAASDLTVKHYADWIPVHSKLDGLTWVVARPFTGAVQTRVLLYTTIIEGFHRALPGYEKQKFPGVDPEVLHRILVAARSAAVAQAAIEGLDQELVEKAVTLYTEVSFQERAAAIVAEVTGVIPELTESIANLPRRITKARNNLAHHLTRKARKPIEVRVLEWLVVSEAISWLLRALLLLRVGIDPQVLRRRFLDFQRFGFFRANTQQHVSELGWDLPAPPS